MMTERSRLFEAIRLGLFAGAIAGMGAAYPGFVYAQDSEEDQTEQEQAADEDADAADLGRVRVTGSRIQRPGIDTFFPAITVDAQLLEDRAFTNVADALNEIPTFGNPDATPFGVQNSFSVGQNFVDFLGLGAQRTLTLVNGRRFVSGNIPSIFGESGGLQVDFNVIPVALVERIETIGVGGAPIYGADAIAGTINVILKDRYEGAEFLVRKGMTSKGDAEFENVLMVAGANSFDGRGNVTMSAEWFRQDGLFGVDRPRFSSGLNDVQFLEGDDGFQRIFRDRRLQRFTDGGAASPGPGFAPADGFGIWPDGNFYQFDSNSNLFLYDPGEMDPSNINFALGGSGSDFFDQVEQLQSPVDRGVFTASMNYDITPSVTFSSDILFSDSNATELTNQGGFQSIFGGTSGPLLFSSDHPFLSDQARQLLQDNGLDTFYLNRFNNDIIDSSADREQQTWRWTGGLNGEFFLGDRRFDWEIYAVHGESDAETFQEGIIDGRFLNAIDVRVLTEEDLEMVDPLDIISIGGTGPTIEAGDFICEAVFQAALDPSFGAVSGNGLTAENRPFIDGCVPLNLFGEGARSEAAREWVTGDRFTNTRIEQTVYNFNIGTELFQLPAGGVATNVGYERRRETALFSPGLGTEIPVTRSAPFAETGGEFNTDEYFGEVIVPIFSPDMEIPGLSLLELNGAIREIENDIADNATVWTLGGRWAPIQDLTFRGNYTEAIRSPSLVELFAPVTQSFSTADDPCDFRFIDEGPNPAQRRANCATQLGFDPEGFESLIVNATSVGRSGGNPNLTNEEAESWSVGFSYEPSFVDNLIIGFDYIDVALDNAISNVTLTTLMTACLDAADFPNNSACDAFERDENGQVIDFLTGQANAAFQNVQVMDLFVNYRFDLANAIGAMSAGMADKNLGMMGANIRISRERLRESSIVGEDIVPSRRSFTSPEYQGNFDISWERNDTRVFLRTNWQNRARLSPSQQNFFFDLDGNQVTSTRHRFISNLTISQTLPQFFDFMPEDTTLQLTVNNLFRRTPNTVEQAAGHFTLTELLGRQYTLTLRGRY